MSTKLLVALVLSIATSAILGCSGTSASGAASNVLPTGFSKSIGIDDTAFLRATGTVVVVMNETLLKETDPTYGKIFAYARGTKTKKSQIVHALVGQNIVFQVTDPKHMHSAALLGAASGTGAPWPASFDGSKAASAPGEAIGTPGWATGPILLGASSATYSTGAAGYYMIGCQYHYRYGMRTIVIVQ